MLDLQMKIMIKDKISEELEKNKGLGREIEDTGMKRHELGRNDEC